MSNSDVPDDLSKDADSSLAPNELENLSDGEHTDLDNGLKTNRTQRRRSSKSPSPETPKRNSRGGTPKSNGGKARGSRRKSSGPTAPLQADENTPYSGGKLDKASKRSIKDARSSSDPIATLSGLSSAPEPLPMKSPIATESTITSQAENLDSGVKSGKISDECLQSSKEVTPNEKKRGQPQQSGDRKRHASSPEQAFQGIPATSSLLDSSASGAPKEVTQSDESDEVSCPNETTPETRCAPSSTLKEDGKLHKNNLNLDDRPVTSTDLTQALHQADETFSRVEVPGKRQFLASGIRRPRSKHMGKCDVSEVDVSKLWDNIEAVKMNQYDRSQLPQFDKAHTIIARDMALVSSSFGNEYECSWNHVHWTIGRLAAKAMNRERGMPTFGFHDVTMNRRTKESKKKTDVEGGQKLTDFVITYDANDDELTTAMDMAVKSIGEHVKTPINAIANLQREPISVAIETKSGMSPTKDIDEQTKSFACPSFARVYNLIRQRTSGVEIVLPPMPMLHVTGPMWKFFLVTVEIDKVYRTSDKRVNWIYKQWPSVEFGSTSETENIDKIVLMLQVLMEWTETEYMPWFSKHVCGTPGWKSSYQKRSSCTTTKEENPQHQDDSKTGESEQEKSQDEGHISDDLHNRFITTLKELSLITWGFLCVLMISWVWPFIRRIGSHISQLRARKMA